MNTERKTTTEGEKAKRWRRKDGNSTAEDAEYTEKGKARQEYLVAGKYLSGTA